jgi:hypothetical protein
MNIHADHDDVERACLTASRRQPIEHRRTSVGHVVRDAPSREVLANDFAPARVRLDEHHALAGEEIDSARSRLGARVEPNADGEREHAPHTYLALHLDLAAHRVHEPLADREPETRSPVSPRHGRVDL